VWIGMMSLQDIRAPASSLDFGIKPCYLQAAQLRLQSQVLYCNPRSAFWAAGWKGPRRYVDGCCVLYIRIRGEVCVLNRQRRIYNLSWSNMEGWFGFISYETRSQIKI
jgi:hypothetical protein